MTIINIYDAISFNLYIAKLFGFFSLSFKDGKLYTSTLDYILIVYWFIFDILSGIGSSKLPKNFATIDSGIYLVGSYLTMLFAWILQFFLHNLSLITKYEIAKVVHHLHAVDLKVCSLNLKL